MSDELGPEIPFGPAPAEDPPLVAGDGWPAGSLWIGALAALGPVGFEFVFRQRTASAEQWMISPSTVMFGLYAMAAGALAQYERSQVNLGWKISMAFFMAMDAIYALSLADSHPGLGLIEYVTIFTLGLVTVAGFVISYSPTAVTGRSLLSRGGVDP